MYNWVFRWLGVALSGGFEEGCHCGRAERGRWCEGLVKKCISKIKDANWGEMVL